MRPERVELLSWLPVLLVLWGCSDGNAPSEAARILPGTVVEEMLDQCSRDAPARGEDTWQPTARDVREFEAELLAELPGQLNRVSWLRPSEREQLSGFPEDFDREYVGIIRNGKRFIYGSFGPKRGMADVIRHAEEGPIITCDGGPVFFGAEYDVAAKQFTHWGFNGPFG